MSASQLHPHMSELETDQEYESGQHQHPQQHRLQQDVCLVNIPHITCLLCDITVDLVFQSQAVYKYFSIYAPVNRCTCGKCAKMLTEVEKVFCCR